MLDQILIYWILIFIIFLIINLVANSTTFGMIGGFWLMLLGLAILVSGIQIQTGMTVGDSISYVSSDVIFPFSEISFIWGIFFIGVSIYMIIANAMKCTT